MGRSLNQGRACLLAQAGAGRRRAQGLQLGSCGACCCSLAGRSQPTRFMVPAAIRAPLTVPCRAQKDFVRYGLLRQLLGVLGGNTGKQYGPILKKVRACGRRRRRCRSSAAPASPPTYLSQPVHRPGSSTPHPR